MMMMMMMYVYVLQQTSYEDYNTELEENNEAFRDCVEAAETSQHTNTSSQHQDADTNRMQYVDLARSGDDSV